MKKNVWYRGVIMVGLLAVAQTANADWQKLNRPPKNVNFLLTNGTNLFAGLNVYFGYPFYISSDNGESWTEIDSGLANKQKIVRSVAVIGTNLFVGTNLGVCLSTNNGATWNTVDTGLTNIDVQSLVSSGSNLFAGTDAGVFVSSNNGASWAHADSGIDPGITPKRIASLAVSGTNLFASSLSSTRIYKSTNSGAQWTKVDSEDYYWGSTRFLATSGTNICAWSNLGGFLFSSNNGDNWSRGNSKITADTSFDTLKYITPVYDTIADSLLRMDTVINDIRKYVDSLPNSLGISGSNIFALPVGVGAYNIVDRCQIHVSSNNGAAWKSIPVNSGKTNIISMAVNQTYLFALSDSGVWRRPLSEIVNNLPSKPQIIPLQTKLNVSASVTAQAGIKVNYSLASRCKVGLGIYTIAGEKLVSLEQGEQAPGTFSASLPADKIQAGLYICRFQAGNRRESALVRVMK
jgi:hypothetical protein